MNNNQKYICKRCGYNTEHKKLLIKHLRRKFICNPIYQSIDRDILLHEMKTITYSNLTGTYDCKYCGKQYSTSNAKYKHQKKCPEIENFDHHFKENKQLTELQLKYNKLLIEKEQVDISHQKYQKDFEISEKEISKLEYDFRTQLKENEKLTEQLSFKSKEIQTLKLHCKSIKDDYLYLIEQEKEKYKQKTKELEDVQKTIKLYRTKIDKFKHFFDVDINEDIPVNIPTENTSYPQISHTPEQSATPITNTSTKNNSQPQTHTNAHNTNSLNTTNKNNNCNNSSAVNSYNNINQYITNNKYILQFGEYDMRFLVENDGKLLKEIINMNRIEDSKNNNVTPNNFVDEIVMTTLKSKDERHLNAYMETPDSDKVFIKEDNKIKTIDKDRYQKDIIEDSKANIERVSKKLYITETINKDDYHYCKDKVENYEDTNEQSKENITTVVAENKNRLEKLRNDTEVIDVNKKHRDANNRYVFTHDD
jgi:hypothetical protein